MRSISRFGRGSARTLAAGIAAVGAIALSTTAATADTTTALTPEHVDALVKPSIVFITGQYSGHVRYTTSTGHRISSTVTASYYCSGFVVANADGEATVATAGHCADRAEGKDPLIIAFLADQVHQHLLTPAQARGLVGYGEANWTVFGDTVGSPINQRIDVYEPAAVSGLATSTSMQATVVAVRGFDKGDVALLQVHTQQPLPVLQVSTSEPQNGAEVTAVGYPSAVRDVSDSSLDPSFETGHVNSIQTRDGLPVIQFDAGLSPGMSGGPVVNDQGEVVGINSYRNSGETQQFNFAVDLSTIHAFLSSHNVDNTLSDADQAYRTGLTDFFDGQYQDAVDQFNTTLNQLPSHALAQQYKSKATALVPATSTDQAAGNHTLVWVAVGAAASVLLLAGGLIVIVRALGGRRSSARDASMSPLAGIGVSPLPGAAGPNAGFMTAGSTQPAQPTMRLDGGVCESCGNARSTSAYCPANGTAHGGPTPAVPGYLNAR